MRCRQICILARKFCRFHVANICATTYIEKKVSDFLAVYVRAESDGSPHETRYYRNGELSIVCVIINRNQQKKITTTNSNAWITVVGVYVRESILSE